MNYVLINTILLIIVNTMLFFSCVYFYYNNLTERRLPFFVFYFLKIAAAMMLSGTLVKVLLDLEDVINGRCTHYPNIDVIADAIGNFGTCFIIPVSLYNFFNLKKMYNEIIKKTENNKNTI